MWCGGARLLFVVLLSAVSLPAVWAFRVVRVGKGLHRPQSFSRSRTVSARVDGAELFVSSSVVLYGKKKGGGGKKGKGGKDEDESDSGGAQANDAAMQAAKDELKACNDKMKKTMDSLSEQLSGIQAGRASPRLLDKVEVEISEDDGSKYNQPLKFISTITSPDPSTLQVNCYDTRHTVFAEKAIMTQESGMLARNMGDHLIVKLPIMTQERRQELQKKAKTISEECKVSLRTARRDSVDKIKKSEKKKELSEDQSKTFQEDIQKYLDGFIKKVDQETKKKEEEIMKV
uniref:Ribosome recycling factor domain-containing protein n=1 Tax=Chromera velia CCMP2878 TaxID=1169474 RepID=A0A0G4FDJ4_9ALVE|mmetsp:Transcript_8357/g.16241  ORF Transcript_8357/g.16241 Transcript_8357/m.16241 type:complete len:288 (+) Transcript_8357:84-947(+)|eukprot:Cvel_3210.t1-p1 / transcript=Cvel_3210.t1 / gene=Cvel_3210 / organism=Chromera_velia_CCMP2878 / gene_product=Ribosome-recycling factor, putative / transcript_product=Ribosome-recycling factor, putative / location=Cvel_scaffold125:74302-76900(-) / protein_length=287 / sequence_SO=supercontig / SO=protein_coding / is_pseudo=false